MPETQNIEEINRRKRSARARAKVETRARKLLFKALKVYEKGLASDDERHAKSCADAIRDIAIGRPSRQAPRDDTIEDTTLIFSELPEQTTTDGDGQHQSFDLESD